MNVFKAVKENVTAREAAEHYGIKVNRKGMAICPFHADKNPSMKLDRRYHCFGCQADGDVIDFVLQYLGLSILDAATKIADDFGIAYEQSTHDPPGNNSVVPSVQQKSIGEQFYQAEELMFRVYSDYLQLLKQWKEEYAPKSPGEDYHPLFEEALDKISYVEYLLDTILEGDHTDRVQLMIDKGREVKQLEKRIREFYEGRGDTAKGSTFRNAG